MSYQWLRGHYQNNEYGYLQFNYKVNENIDFQIYRTDFSTSRACSTARSCLIRPTYTAGNSGRVTIAKIAAACGTVTKTSRPAIIANEIAGFLDVNAVLGATSRQFVFDSKFRDHQLPERTGGLFVLQLGRVTLTGVGYKSNMLVLSSYY